MAGCRTFLKFAMFTGFMLLLFRDNLANWIQWRQNVRKQQIKGMCEEFSEGRYGSENMTADMFEHFVVDDTHRLIYCYIPKVACTNWKRMMLALKRGKPYPNILTSIDPFIVHETSTLSYLKDFDANSRMERLKNYTKFLFVRDPFIRVVSAFRDKFEYNYLHEYFYQTYGRVMLKRYGNQPNPPRTMRVAYALGIRPTFHNFVQFLVDPESEKEEAFEPHWRQMHRLCHPCLVQYDFVGHQETLQDDAPELLKMLNIENDMRFPSSTNANMTSLDYAINLFNTVPLEDRRKLYKVYEWDFKLFGYRRPKEWLDY